MPLATVCTIDYMANMADEPESLTLRLLHEMRAEMRETRSEVLSRFAAIDERLKDVTQRVNGVAVVMSSVAGITHDHEERIEQLESR